MISVTYFALENIAISKVKIDQDQPEWRRSGAGKKCDVMFQRVFSATFQMKHNYHKLLFTISYALFFVSF